MKDKRGGGGKHDTEASSLGTQIDGRASHSEIDPQALDCG